MLWKALLRFDIKELIECSAAGTTQTGLGRVLRAPLILKEKKTKIYIEYTSMDENWKQ